MNGEYQQPDPQIERATQETLQVIARMYEHAIDAVWSDYPTPAPKPQRTVHDERQNHSWPTSRDS